MLLVCKVVALTTWASTRESPVCSVPVVHKVEPLALVTKLLWLVSVEYITHSILIATKN